MPIPTPIEKITLCDKDGNKVSALAGDLVDLADSDPGEDVTWLERNHTRLLREELGEPPYEISEIAVWPCRRVMIYIKSERCSSSGVWPSDLQYVGANPSKIEVGSDT